MIHHARRARIETALAVACVALLGLTLVWHDWIEVVFHVDPDSGSGAAEWGVVGALALAALALGAAARADWRRATPR